MEVEDDEESNPSHSTLFQTILYNNLNHVNQMMMINKNNDDVRSRSLKRRLNDLISTVSPAVVTDESDTSSNCDQSPTNTTTNYSRVVTNCSLEFEYYSKNEAD